MGLLQTSCSNFGVTVLVLIREGCTQRIHFLLSTEGFYLQVFLVLHSRKKKKAWEVIAPYTLQEKEKYI